MRPRRFAVRRLAAVLTLLLLSPFALRAQGLTKDVERQLLAARDTVWRASFANAGSGRLERVDFAGTKIALDGAVAVLSSSYTTVTRTGERVDTTRGRATYDALVGFWEFRFQNRNTNGTFGPAFRGHWSFEKKPGGLLIEDRWRSDDPSAPMGVSTYTYRTFDAQRKVWQMLGAHSTGGEFALGLTWAKGDERFGIQRYGDALMRIRYLPIEPNRFLWRADRSTDGGVTWTRDVWTMEATRIGR